MRRGSLPKEDTLVVRMETPLLNQFRKLAEDIGVPMSRMVREYIRKEIEDRSQQNKLKPDASAAT